MTKWNTSLEKNTPSEGLFVRVSRPKWGENMTTADERIIRASRQLLEACERAMAEYMDRAWTDPSNPDGPCADLRSAIAKATQP